MLRTADKRLFAGDQLRHVVGQLGPVQYDTYGQSGSNSFNVSVAAPGSANTKVGAAYTEIAASTAFDADGFYLTISNFSAIADFLVDVALGAASSEVVILENLLVSAGFSSTGSTSLPGRFFVPLPIPAGSMIAVRCQSSDASASFRVGIQICAGGMYSLIRAALPNGRATTYGADTSDSGGMQVDPGASINTKGSWSTIDAAIADDMRAFLLCVGNKNNAGQSTQFMLLDFGEGAGPTVYVGNLFLSPNGLLNGIWPATNPLMYASLPAGTAISARAQSSGNDTTDRLLDVAVIGFS